MGVGDGVGIGVGLGVGVGGAGVGVTGGAVRVGAFVGCGTGVTPERVVWVGAGRVVPVAFTVGFAVGVEPGVITVLVAPDLVVGDAEPVCA